MPSQILTTKLYIPLSNESNVTRPRLINLLDKGLSQRLILISAPAGFGKTTLVSDWVRNNELPKIWISLDKDDNEPTRFLTYLDASITQVFPELDLELQNVVFSPGLASPVTLLTPLLNEISALPHEFILVLDDYFFIQSDLIHEIISFLIKHLPPNMHLVIITREDPPLSLAQLRARQQIMEVRADDLRFLKDEAREFFNSIGMEISLENIRTLESFTEGWIAGLQLAALSIEGNQDSSSFIESFADNDRYVVDYLAEEVIEKQPEAIKNFLLQTSILDRLSGDLCDAVTKTKNGQNMLETIEKSNLFIVSLDNKRHWFRYHRLFVSMLRQRLMQTQPEKVAELHLRAADWFEQNQLAPESIHHALEGKDFEGAALKAERVAQGMLQQGAFGTLLGWLSNMPDELVTSRPWLSIFHAWVLALTRQSKKAAERLKEAERHFNAKPFSVDKEAMISHTEIIQAQLALLSGDLKGAIHLNLQAHKRLPENDLFLQGATLLGLGRAYYLLGDFENAEHYLEEANSKGQTFSIILAMVTTYLRVRIKISLGKLKAAHWILESSSKLVKENERNSSPAIGYHYLAWCELLIEGNKVEKAEQYLTKALNSVNRSGNPDMLVCYYVNLAQLYQARGDGKGAIKSIETSEKNISQYGENLYWTIPSVIAYRIQLLLIQGNLSEAAHWVNESGFSIKTELGYKYEVENLIKARFLIAQEGKSLNEALGLLDRLQQEAEDNKRLRSLIEIYILQALAFLAKDDLDKAKATFSQALSLAEPEGFIRLFLDKGDRIAYLLQQVNDKNISSRFISNLQNSFQNVEDNSVPLSKANKYDLDSLSKRELEVLQALSEGLTNKEVARKLFLSVNTIKVHTNRIYRKLGANSRTDAIAKARKLNFLS